MPHVRGVDHVAFASADLEATCAFCDRLFGARTHLDCPWVSAESNFRFRCYRTPNVAAPAQGRASRIAFLARSSSQIACSAATSKLFCRLVGSAGPTHDDR
jgi:hypothetical protein